MNYAEISTLGNFRQIPGTKMFRSANPDNISQEDLEILSKFPICALYDMRDTDGYSKSRGKKRSDAVYSTKVVHPCYEEGGPKFSTPKDRNIVFNDLPPGKYHYLFDLTSKESTKEMRYGIPWILRVVHIIADILGWLFGGSFWARLMRNMVYYYYGSLGGMKYTLQHSQPQIRAVLRTMALRCEIPGIICCFHGKDRTALMAILLCALVGGDKETIVQDYIKTEEFMKTQRRSFWSNCKTYGFKSALIRSFHVTSVQRETVTGILAYIQQEYGSVGGYLTKIGFGEMEQEDLRRKIRL